MRALVLGDHAGFDAWLERRRELGQDRFDEVWEGEYHVAPGPDGPHGLVDHQLVRRLGPRADVAGLYGCTQLNIGELDDYRVPDGAYLRTRRSETFNPTAAIVIEIVSPGDESRLKFDFYFRHGVEEVLIIDPDPRTVEWFVRGSGGFVPADGSVLLDVTAAELASEIDWPD